VAACHDCSDGGLLTAVAEMAIAGGAAARITLADVPMEADGSAGNGPALHRDLAIAFTETPGRFVCEVPVAVADRFAVEISKTNAVPWAWIGNVVAGDQLEIVSTAGSATTVPVASLARAWRGGA
jgi:phosphoribosylformylglycinamidine synthase